MALTFEEYQRGTSTTAVYPESKALEYTALGLAGEAGEVANKVKKLLRQDDGDPVRALIALADELGDVLWYASELATTLGVELEQVAKRNLDKLQERKEAGSLKGTGDSR